MVNHDPAAAGPFSLEGRRILVTGASSGLGRATAAVLGALGARVVLVGRDPARLAEATAAVPGAGHQAERFDMAATDQIGPWFGGLAKSGGPFDGLVHAAGLHAFTPLRTLELDEVGALMRVNLDAALALAQAFRKKGANRGGGSLVFLASVAGLVGQPGLAAYSATKGALLAAARALAVELAPERIRVNCVAPGMVRTEMADRIRETLAPEHWDAVVKGHPLGLGEPADVAHAVAFLLSDAARWISGTTLVVDGAYTAQ
jgi:NAD(P)-dependent dehydrogenase (short-subunit alcohol dehydrogenase family)